MRALVLVVPLLAGGIYFALDRVPQSADQVVAATTESDAVAQDPHADCAAERDALLARIERLEARLGTAQADALQREEDWIEYNRMIVSIAPEDLFPELHAAKVQEALADGEPAPLDPALEAM